MVTPMDDSGLVNWQALSELVDSQVSAGVDGVVPVGTTGESPTLTPEEHIKVIEVVVEAAAGRVPVIAGTGANSTDEALHLTRQADIAGAVINRNSRLTLLPAGAGEIGPGSLRVPSGVPGSMPRIDATA